MVWSGIKVSPLEVGQGIRYNSIFGSGVERSGMSDGLERGCNDDMVYAAAKVDFLSWSCILNGK